jgi:hypothetical protein
MLTFGRPGLPNNRPKAGINNLEAKRRRPENVRFRREGANDSRQRLFSPLSRSLIAAESRHLALLATLAIASTGAALPQEANAPEVIHAESA